MMGTNIPRPTKRPPTPAMNHPVPEKNRTNCPNCCAVITGPICEYCGTRFEERQQQIVIPLNITAEQAAETFRRWNESMFGMNPCLDDKAP